MGKNDIQTKIKTDFRPFGSHDSIEVYYSHDDLVKTVKAGQLQILQDLLDEVEKLNMQMANGVASYTLADIWDLINQKIKSLEGK